jgi:anti-sigma factor RsiW
MHVSDEDLDLYLSEGLGNRKAETVDSHLAECAACAVRVNSANSYAKQLADLGRIQAAFGWTEKRREARVGADEAGVLQRISPFSQDRFDVRILNVSTEGLSVTGPHSLEPGTNVKVRLKRMIAFGEVRHRRMVGGAYHAGIQLHDAIPL